ncbi:MAG: sigma-54-dependent Fis family transcriptional regulator [Nitrospirae bacterium]|nr:sigma-54-dependent Fis family transcriptional regulator [Nitrospirota bacterium]
MFARAIHEWSPRSKRPFVIVDTPAISDTLFESDLFGHVRGAFTGAINDRKGYFEMAHRGTLFLDEIGDLSGRIQAGLLGVLQRYEIKRVGSSSPIKVDVRVIAATNRNLSDDIDRGTFREDLYYRLNVLPVELPPLRERREDIEPLAHYFLGKYCAENGISNLPIKGITSEALGRLKAHSWRGNIRELENVIARAVTMAKGKWITEADLNINHFTSINSILTQIPRNLPSPPLVKGGWGDLKGDYMGVRGSWIRRLPSYPSWGKMNSALIRRRGYWVKAAARWHTNSKESALNSLSVQRETSIRHLSHCQEEGRNL